MKGLDGISVVTKYQTPDGKEWPSAEAAKLHMTKMEYAKKLKDLLSVSLSTGRSEAIVLAMLEDAAAVQALLCDFRKRLPFSERGIVLKKKPKLVVDQEAVA